MKVLPMMQPWASLVVEGPKVTETRDKHTNVRGPILVLATQTIVPYEDARYAWDFLAGWRGLQADEAPTLVQTERRGRVIGGVHVVDSVRAQDCNGVPMTGWARRGMRVDVGESQVKLGDYGPGRRVWLLEGAVTFDQPIVARGMPGWFDAPPDIERESLVQWSAVLTRG